MSKDGECEHELCDVAKFCEYLRPPPLPRVGNKEPFLQFINSNPIYKRNFDLYNCVCNVTLDDTNISPSTVVGASSSVVTIVVVLVILAVLVSLTFLLTWLYKRHKRTGRGVLPPLPLSTYQTTNYLDNKARKSQCWQDTSETTPEKPCNGNTENEYIQMPDSETQTSVRKLKRVSKGSSQGPENEGVELASACHDNKNFVNDDDAHSPGTDSNLPLFADMVDGTPSPLPNVPDNINGNAVQDLSNNSDIQIRSNRLPPLQRNNSQSSATGKSNKSPHKKKKNRMFNRNSEPVRSTEEENQRDNTLTL